MKFFSFEWWQRRQYVSRIHDPVPAYEAHMNAIRAELPADLLRLDGEVSLHDARLRELTVHVAEHTLVLILDGDEWSGGAPRITLRFGGVIGFETTTNGDESLPGPGGYGDLGYWEVDLAPNGYELRMLYSTGIEMLVRFREVQVETAGRDATRKSNDD